MVYHPRKYTQILKINICLRTNKAKTPILSWLNTFFTLDDRSPAETERMNNADLLPKVLTWSFLSRKSLNFWWNADKKSKHSPTTQLLQHRVFWNWWVSEEVAKLRNLLQFLLYKHFFCQVTFRIWFISKRFLEQDTRRWLSCFFS